jgi:hypothetical protein
VTVRVLPAAAVLDSENVTLSVEVFESCSVRVRDSLKVIESVGSGREKLCAVRSADSANVMLSSAVTSKDAGAAAACSRPLIGAIQNGHFGFGFSRPVVGPKLGIA